MFRGCFGHGVFDFGNILADHFADQLQSRQLGRGECTDQPTVAEHGNAIANGVNLVEKVRDENDAQTFVAQPAHDGEQFRDFARVEARCRLVENQQFCRGVQSPGDGDHLLHGDRATRQFLPNIELQIQSGQSLCCPAGHRTPGNHPQPHRFTTQANIFRHRQVRNQIHFLVNRADADRFGRFGRARIDCLAGAQHRAGIARIDAGQHFDERAFPSAVLPHQGMNFAPADREIDAIQRLHAGKSLGNSPGL